MPTDVQLDDSDPIEDLSGSRHVRDSEAWDKTDRPFRFPGRRHGTAADPRASATDSARMRWLEQNHVYTEWIDAGIGCCWFAYHGDEEPVCGETEHEAISRVAEQNGLTLWSGAG